MKTEFQGAEATVTVGKTVKKDRKRKNYRHRELDRKIREERTGNETRILEKARQNGVNVPKVLETSTTEFEMEKIEGKILKETVEDNSETVKRLAEQVARLHQADVIHGDLTTSNAILSDGEVYLIDFGLAYHSERVEDKAVDIHLLKQVFKASHTEHLWQVFEEKYRQEGDNQVTDKVPEIEERARYR